jgi:hypothetical protein
MVVLRWPQVAFKQWNRGWFWTKKPTQSTYLNELDDRKPLLVSVLRRHKDDVRLCNLYQNLTPANPGWRAVPSNASPGWLAHFLGVRNQGFLKEEVKILFRVAPILPLISPTFFSFEIYSLWITPPRLGMPIASRNYLPETLIRIVGASGALVSSWWPSRCSLVRLRSFDIAGDERKHFLCTNSCTADIWIEKKKKKTSQSQKRVFDNKKR